MKIPKKYSATKIGAFFAAGSFLLISFAAPILAVMPGILMQQFINHLAGNEILNQETLPVTGTITLITLVFIFLVTLLLIATIVLKQNRKGKQLSNKVIIAIMAAEYFIIHPIGFYMLWALMNFQGDGQITMGALFSYPVSSFGFIAIGAYIDMLTKYSQRPTAL